MSTNCKLIFQEYNKIVKFLPRRFDILVVALFLPVIVGDWMLFSKSRTHKGFFTRETIATRLFIAIIFAGILSFFLLKMFIKVYY